MVTIALSRGFCDEFGFEKLEDAYRVMDGKAINVQMKAAMVEEKEGRRLVVGLNNIDAQVRQVQELERALAQAQTQANRDALTGVKNKHAFTEAQALRDGGIVIACGMARFENDDHFAAVFQRADRSMYENKNALKLLS